jgi:hypothetical protein
MLEALDSAGHLHDEPVPPGHFSYSRKEHGALQRIVIRCIERLTGQPRLERLYRAWAENPHPHENIFAASLRLLSLRLDMDEAALAKIPRSRPVLFVANHPDAGIGAVRRDPLDAWQMYGQSITANASTSIR